MEDIIDPTTTDPGEGRDTTPTGAPPPPHPPARRLRRARRGPVAGVATGVADYLGIEAIIVQAVFIGLTIVGGSGLFLYLAAWLLVATDDDPDPRPIAISTTHPVRVIFGTLFAFGAISSLFGAFSFGQGENVVIPLLLIGGGFYILNQRGSQIAHADSSGSADPAAPYYRTPPPPRAEHWAATRTNDDVVMDPVIREPRLPITSVTLAIAATAAGILLAIDQLTGADIGAAVLFGTSLAIVGAGLVVSAFRGRALPLVPLGLILTLGLLLSPIFDASIDGGLGERTINPTSEGDVLATYDLGAGPLELDLRNVTFTEDRTIEVNVGAGYAEIHLPSDVNLQVDGYSKAGYVEIFGRETAGISSSSSASASASNVVDDSSRPTITLIAKVTFGYVEVSRG